MWAMTEHPHLLPEKVERDVRKNIVVIVRGQLIIRQLRKVQAVFIRH